MAKQVLFIDDENNAHGGILLDDGSVICGCCGSVFEADEANDTFTIIKVFSTWIDLDEEICGDELLKY